jgi:hypothetical protein
MSAQSFFRNLVPVDNPGIVQEDRDEVLYNHNHNRYASWRFVPRGFGASPDDESDDTVAE